MPGAGAVLQAGTLDQRITFLSRPTTQSATGADIGVEYAQWTVEYSVWAARTPVGGMEMRRAGQEVAESMTGYMIRYHQPLPDTAWVIQHRGLYYEIKDVSDIDTARQAVSISCKLISSQQTQA